MALVFKRLNNLELAKEALKRIKMMTEEVQEAESAIAEGQI
jgi:hypothetical protein